MKQKLNIIKSTCVPLPLENIDTDQIIPARFLKATDKQGFGDNLFRDWRYDKNNQPIKDFVLNNPKYGGCILVAGRNFGSGSSREHAAWGPLQAMDSVLLLALSLQTFTKITNLTTLYFLLLYLKVSLNDCLTVSQIIQR